MRKMFGQAREAWIWALFHRLEGIKAGRVIAPEDSSQKRDQGMPQLFLQESRIISFRLTNAVFVMVVVRK